MSNIFKYKISISNASKILTVGTLSALLTKAEYIVIESGEFNRFRECERALNKLLSKIAVEETTNKDKFVIVAKQNPNLLDESDLDEPPEGWEEDELLKAFIVNSEHLKDPNKTLLYSVCGSITYAETVN